jgi:hypothetical protein
MVVPLHVQDVEVGKAVAVEIGEGRIPAPAGIREADGIGDIHEPVVACVAVEAALLRACRFQVTREGVLVPQEVPARPLLVDRVLADVDEKEVEQSVVVVVEEDGARGVADVVEAGLLRDVLEVPLPVILEEDVAARTVVT